MAYSITEDEKGILKETASIGIGNASRALEQLLNAKIEVNVPEVNVLPVKDMPMQMPGSELLHGISIRILGDSNGVMLFVFKEEDAKRLTKEIMYQNMKTSVVDEQTEIGVLKEVANILSGAYLTALTKFTSLSLLPSIPQSVIGNCSEICQLLNFQPDQEMILIKSKLTIKDQVIEVIGSLVLSLSENELKKLIQSILDKYKL